VLKLARFLVECVGDVQLPVGVEVLFELGDMLTEACAYGAGFVGLLRVIKKAVEILRDVHRHL
jgi:hypothetical protein